MKYSDSEGRARAIILEKDKALRLYLAEHRFTDSDDPAG